ncbi:hypothetical protein D3C72_1916910 [compost metagenome]
MGTERAALQQAGEVEAALAADVFVQARAQLLAQFLDIGVAGAGAVGVVQLEVGAPAQELLAVGDEGGDADAGGHQDVLPCLSVQREEVGRWRQAQAVADLQVLVQVARAAPRGVLLAHGDAVLAGVGGVAQQ